MKPNTSNEKNDSLAKSNFPEYNGNLEEFIKTMSDHQVTCERAGRYQEADLARQRLIELKKELEKKQREDQKQRHINELMGVEKAHFEEFNQFNEFWERKMVEFAQEADKVEQELIRRQQDEFNIVSQDLDKAIPFKPKESSEILNLRKMEEHLAKQDKTLSFIFNEAGQSVKAIYLQDAHQLQQKRLQLEKEELEAWQKQRQAKIKNQLNQLQTKQVNELGALRQRIIAGKEEQRKNRSIELERLLQKYQNVKKELEAQHKKEMLAFDNQFTSKVQIQTGGSRQGYNGNVKSPNSSQKI